MVPFPANGVGVFTEEEDIYRDMVRRFLDRELDADPEKFVTNPDEGRLLFEKAGQAGLLGAAIPEAYGGSGADGIFGIILSHELGRSIGGATVGSSLQNDISTSVLVRGGSEALLETWAAGILSGEVTQCMAMTEADAGSDFSALRTTAVRDGDEFIINGSKTYISNGGKAHLIYLVAQTDPSASRGRGLSMVMVEKDTPGVTFNAMKTMGYEAYDLVEFHFDNVRVPTANLLLGEGRALELLVPSLSLDHLELAARALGEAELAYGLALEWALERKINGQPLFEFQNTQFKLAEMKTDISVGRVFLEERVRRYRLGDLKIDDTAMAKLWLPEMSGRVIDAAFQMFGGAGFMDEMPISKLYRCNRLNRVYGGSSEVQKLSIAKKIRAAA